MLTPGEARRILRAAVLSRFLLLFLVCLWRLLLRPYDTSASLNPPCLSGAAAATPSPPQWPRVGAAIERSVVWDGVYFLRIAECGYEYEQTYAFFPALPVCISLLARTVFAPLVPLIGNRAALALAGYALNNFAFLIAALYFYRLSVLVLDDEAAFKASMLFCFNPASVFYSSIYSESLYALFSLGGAFHLISGSDAIAVLLLALSGATRSNGAINAGYICFRALHRVSDAMSRKKPIFSAARDLAAGGAQAACVFAPLIGFQAYGYANLCFGRTADERRPWCESRIPRLYGYVQSHYWDVGFLRYFQVKQLPNFLLASPMLFLAAGAIIQYARLRPEAVFSMALRAPAEERRLAAGPPRSEKRAATSIERERGPATHTEVRRRKKSGGYSSILVLPFVYHLAFMAAAAVLFMHVQVATRFLSASPPIYWSAAGRFGRGGAAASASAAGRLMAAYFAAFFLLGSLLFSTFYPFT